MHMIECEIVTVTVIAGIDPKLRQFMPLGDVMTHRTFGLPGDLSPDTGLRLIACVGWFVSKEQYKVVNAQLTCVRCIATRRP